MHFPMHLQSLSCKIWNKVGKPTSTPLPLNHEGLGHFARRAQLRSNILPLVRVPSLRWGRPCAYYFLSYRKDTFTL